MKITEDSVPPCGTAEQAISEEEALQRGMEEKSREFCRERRGGLHHSLIMVKKYG